MRRADGELARGSGRDCVAARGKVSKRPVKVGKVSHGGGEDGVVETGRLWGLKRSLLSVSVSWCILAVKVKRQLTGEASYEASRPEKGMAAASMLLIQLSDKPPPKRAPPRSPSAASR